MHIAITGHRPKDLTVQGIGYRQVAELTREMYNRAAKRATLGERITLHTGGALGVDTWTAQTWQDMQRDHDGLLHALHLPFTFDVMSMYWTQTQRDTAMTVVKRTNGQCHTCPHANFSYEAYQRRNEHMVDCGDYVVAFYNGKKGGGTYNCIQYALKVGKPVYNALDNFARLNPRAF